jgi:trimethylamine--corrinoid protein Co-methyltransferase
MKKWGSYLLADEEILKKTHHHSIDIIENCGIRFHSKRALQILDGAGAKIVGEIAKIPGDIIESALKKAPVSFKLCARDAKHDLDLKGSHTYLSQDGCAAFTIDFATGERRPSRKEDIEKMALIADYLENIEIVSPTVSARDIPKESIAVHELEACFAHSTKHIVTESITSARDAQAQIELASVVAGGKDKLRERPLFSNFICTVSPLIQDKGGIEAALEFAEAGIPVGAYSMATAGLSSPITLAGTHAVLNAEVITALALIQLAVPGAKVFYAGGPATLDLRTGSYVASSPEALLLRMLVAEQANFYKIPSIVGAGATSAKVPGPQAAWENALSFLLPSLTGAGFLFGLGLLDGSNLLTYESIVLDNENAAMIRRIVEGINFEDKAFALDIIKKLGPGGVYLNQKHTVDFMRELSVSQLADRDSYEKWFKKGKHNRVELAREKVREILAKHKPEPLPESVRKEMDGVMKSYASTS